MATVSVIMPVHNAAPYIDGAVRSVVAQTMEDWELIAVDDGSTDASGAMLDAWARDPRIRGSRIRVLHVPNGGVSAARNLALDLVAEEGKSRYVTFLDADDLLHPQFLQTTTAMLADPETDIAMSAYRRFKGKLEAMPELDPYADKVKVYDSERAAELCLYQRGIDAAPWSKVYRSDLWKGFRFEPGRRYEDLELIPKLHYAARRTALCPVPLYMYRQHGDGYLQRFNFGRLDALWATGRLRAWFQSKSPRLARAARDREMSAAFNMLGLLEVHRKGMEPADRARASEEMSRCWSIIRGQRLESALNGRARLRNRLGALTALLGGLPLTRLLTRLAYP